MNEYKPIIKYFTVDAGWNTGWAFWMGSLLPETGIINAPTDMDLDALDKLDYCADQFTLAIDFYKPEKCCIESIVVWGGSARSMAAWESEDNVYLCYLIGRYMQICRQRGIHVYPLRPIDWKGTMNDELVARRVLRRNKMDYRPMYKGSWTHVTDAVGIGLSIMGIF